MTDGFQPGFKEGTVGRPLPGISAKVVHLQTGEDLGPDQSGMLMVKGPNVMQGYLDQPQLTAEVIRDGWYKTGDVAMIDHDGFIQITGRESRFSKIGGEMVPHLRIEEALNRMLSVNEDRIKLAVTSVPDARRGERLIVLHTGLDQPPEAIRRHLASVGLPPLWIPSQDSFYQVEAIPVLGTGKLDLKGQRLGPVRWKSRVGRPSRIEDPRSITQAEAKPSTRSVKRLVLRARPALRVTLVRHSPGSFFKASCAFPRWKCCLKRGANARAFDHAGKLSW